jgi:hypothetical protein
MQIKKNRRSMRQSDKWIGLFSVKSRRKAGQGVTFFFFFGKCKASGPRTVQRKVQGADFGCRKQRQKQKQKQAKIQDTRFKEERREESA